MDLRPKGGSLGFPLFDVDKHERLGVSGFAGTPRQQSPDQLPDRANKLLAARVFVRLFARSIATRRKWEAIRSYWYQITGSPVDPPKCNDILELARRI
jgi:hypothetical protein